MRILIVDDEKTALKNLERILSKAAPGAYVEKADEAERALELCREDSFDVIFLDISMPDKDGILLAKEIKEINPVTNIIMVTAYPEFALDAYSLYVSDYIVKPAGSERVKAALDNLRYPVHSERKGLYIQCFGNFEVFFDGRPVSFGRAKTKELLAYLVDRRGASATNAALRAVLWRDDVDNSRKQMHYFAQIIYELRTKLNELGASDILVYSRDSYAIDPHKINCDYYHALERGLFSLTSYAGEYMSQYEWAQNGLGVSTETV